MNNYGQTIEDFTTAIITKYSGTTRMESAILFRMTHNRYTNVTSPIELGKNRKHNRTQYVTTHQNGKDRKDDKNK